MGRILIVDCFDSFTFNLYHYLDRLKPGNCDVIRYDNLKTVRLDDYSHIVISPGPGLPDDYPDISDLLSKCGEHKHILGVCLGLQCIVTFFGGKLKNLDRVKHGISSRLHMSGSSLLFNGISDGMRIGHYHSWVTDEVFFPSKQLRITSRDNDNNIMSVEHVSLPVFGIQFHPESVLTDSGMVILQNWLEGFKSS